MTNRYYLQYCASVSEECAEQAMKFPYQKIGTFITLVYGKKHKDFVVADDKFLREMGEEDRAWLASCINDRAKKVAKKKKTEVALRDKEFMERFEQELQKQAEKEGEQDG